MSCHEDITRECAPSRIAEPSAYGRPTIRVSGFIRAHGAVLLVRQTRRSKDYWLLPGGALERGEMLTEALEREVLEEGGLSVRAENDPIALVQTISPDGGKTRHLVQLIFEARPKVAQEEPLPGPLHVESGDPAVKELSWFLPQEIGRLHIHPPIHELLVSWLRFRESNPSDPLPFVSVGPLWAEEQV